MIYLDNSSTTHKKPLSVILSSLSGMLFNSINPSRASYKQGFKVSQKVYKCREKLGEYLGCEPDNVIFTSGCTMALNLALMGTAKKNGNIITTVFEHNSVLRVLDKLKKTQNITFTALSPNKHQKITVADIKTHIRSNTYMIVINHTSNVTGDTQDIDAIGKFCYKKGILLLVDGAQSVGHEKIDMKKMHINILTLAGHKGLYAPQGIGALLINNCQVSPLICGGTGSYSDSIVQPTDYPDGLESGTPNIVGILGLLAGVKYVSRHQDKINNKITVLTRYLIDELNKIKYIQIYSSNYSAGIVSITIDGKDSVYVSSQLDEKFHICTRSGLHCAPLVHKYYKTIKGGMTRISISYFNKKTDIKKLVSALKKIALSN